MIRELVINKTVNGEKIVEKRDIDIYEGIRGRGSLEGEYDLRRLLGLPLTKPLVYYPDTKENNSVSVDSFCITEIYDDWYVITLHFTDKRDPVNIHHRFFSEMQSPSFVEDMKKTYEGED